MGKKCSVGGCRTGYDSIKKCAGVGGAKIPIYRFPKGREQKLQWLHALPNFIEVDNVTLNMGVCALHWPKDLKLVKSGGRYQVPGEPPSIFPNVPKSAVPSVATVVKPSSTANSAFDSQGIHRYNAMRSIKNVYCLMETISSDKSKCFNASALQAVLEQTTKRGRKASVPYQKVIQSLAATYSITDVSMGKTIGNLRGLYVSFRSLVKTVDRNWQKICELLCKEFVFFPQYIDVVETQSESRHFAPFPSSRALASSKQDNSKIHQLLSKMANFKKPYQIKTTKQKLQRYENKIMQLKLEIRKIKSKFSQSERKSKEAADILSLLSKERNKLRVENNQLIKQNTDLEKKCYDLQCTVKDQEKEIEELQKAVKDTITINGCVNCGQLLL